MFIEINKLSDLFKIKPLLCFVFIDLILTITTSYNLQFKYSQTKRRIMISGVVESCVCIYYIAYSVTGRYRKPETNAPVLIQAEPPVQAGDSNAIVPNLTYFIVKAFS